MKDWSFDSIIALFERLSFVGDFVKVFDKVELYGIVCLCIVFKYFANNQSERDGAIVCRVYAVVCLEKRGANFAEPVLR